MNMLAYQIVNEYKKLDEVIAVAIGGSGASGRRDSFSDINIYIITNKDISIAERKKIVEKLSDEKEINNTIWGDTDEFILRNSDIQIDVSYFRISWLKEQLENVLTWHVAHLGYSTCFWYNVINSLVIFDKENQFKDFQNSYKVEYPIQIKKNIIIKNYPVLKDNLSSYYNKIEKAIKRADIVSMNSRVAAFISSYFDIIFAINEMPHPGENKLIAIVENSCKKKPDNFSENILKLLNSSNECNIEMLDTINEMMKNLKKLLKDEGFGSICYDK